MKLTIFDVYVPMEGQEQCDRMKQVCVDNGLPYEKQSYDFNFLNNGTDCFRFSNNYGTFSIWDKNLKQTQVTEPEFLTLLNEYKDKENENKF